MHLHTMLTSTLCSKKSQTVYRRCFFCGSFLLFVFRVCHAVLSVHCSLALWSPVEKGLTSWLSCMWCFLVFCHFPMWCPGSGVVLDCIDSWSLPSFLLLLFVCNSLFSADYCWRKCIHVYTRGKFNNASALGRSLYWCQALHIMNKDRYQSTSARRALALLNSPLVLVQRDVCSYAIKLTNKYDLTVIEATFTPSEQSNKHFSAATTLA